METKTNEELRIAWDFVEHTGRSIFLTGKAGTGKTTFLKTVVERSKKRSIVVAPTGVAAINAGGMTIHSFFQLPFTPYVPNSKIRNKYDFGKEKRRIIASLDLLIIDEISMVRSDLLDAIDAVLRRYRDHYKPFGGVQLLMIGDLQQLTPVVTPGEEALLRPYYDTPYFFGSKALQQIEYVTILLNEVFRQEDKAFLDVLNHIREARPTVNDIAVLNQRCNPAFIPKTGEGYIRLTTHNVLADNYNDEELKKLPGHSYTFKAQVEGNFPEYAYPTSEVLTLKEGAQVMFVKNDPTGEHRYYNGRIGEVVEISESRVCVLCAGDSEGIEVEPLEWENAQYQLNPETRVIETKIQGTFRQLPLRLAWAITIHKSQGLTFERAIIDANLSFAPGQVYVALSRCKTLEGMVLSAPIESRAIITDKRVEDYIGHQEEEAQRSISQLPQLKEEYYRFLLLELFDLHDIFYKEEHLLRLMTEFFYHSFTDITELHKRVLSNFSAQTMAISEKWLQKIRQSTMDQLHTEDFQERVKRSAEWFESSIQEVFANSINLAAQIKSNNKQAMSRFTEALADVRQSVLSRRFLFAKIADQGFSIAIYLHEKQLSLLDAIDEDQIKKTGKQRGKKEKPKKEPKEKTWNITFQLYKQGMTPEEIAQSRGRSVTTIFEHLARFVSLGAITLSELVPPEHQDAILKVIQTIGKGESKTAIKSLCPPEVTYQEIELVLDAQNKVNQRDWAP
ncbi:MAG: helix-turn-helix domain-containing protein [Prevotella sp.]|nr:helix-turn-helix domain-containing protein [Prevotella sp.]